MGSNLKILMCTFLLVIFSKVLQASQIDICGIYNMEGLLIIEKNKRNKKEKKELVLIVNGETIKKTKVYLGTYKKNKYRQYIGQDINADIYIHGVCSKTCSGSFKKIHKIIEPYLLPKIFYDSNTRGPIKKMKCKQ